MILADVPPLIVPPVGTLFTVKLLWMMLADTSWSSEMALPECTALLLMNMSLLMWRVIIGRSCSVAPVLSLDGASLKPLLSGFSLLKVVMLTVKELFLV